MPLSSSPDHLGHRRSRVLVLVLLIPGVLWLTPWFTGCSLQLSQQGPPSRTYWLQPSDVPPAPRSVNATAVPGLDTDRLLAMDPQDNQLIPYAGAAWAGAVPSLVASVVERSLGGDRRGPALDIEVRKFFVERLAGAAENEPAAPGEAVIELAIRDTDRPGRVTTFSARATLSEPRLGAVANAFQRALDEITRDLSSWLRQAPENSGAAAQRSSPKVTMRPAVPSGIS